MKLLVPYDFSKISKNAALYAAHFAKKVEGEITLLHIIPFETPPVGYLSGPTVHKIEEERISDASHECSLFIKEIKSKVKGLKITCEVLVGHMIETIIEEYALHHQIDLIVMGTKGASGLKKVMFGSNAVAVINKSSIPVITVPEYSRFNKIKHIIYASDMHKLLGEVHKLVPIAQFFNASIYVLHILPLGSKKKLNAIKIKENLIAKNNYKKIYFNVLHNDNIVEGINEFTADVKADLVAMYTHKLTFFENLFGKSISDKVAFHSLIPLLTLRK